MQHDPNSPHLKKAREYFGGELENQALFGVGASRVKRESIHPGFPGPIGCIGSVGSGSSQAKKIS